MKAPMPIKRLWLIDVFGAHTDIAWFDLQVSKEEYQPGINTNTHK